jgi:hypothetical protein
MRERPWARWPLKRHFKASIRFGLLAALIMVAFWGAWSLLVGPVPELTALGVVGLGLPENGATLPLPFAYSRWLDVPIAFFIVVANWFTILGATKLAMRYDVGNGDAWSIATGLILGLVFGFGWNWMVGPVVMLGIGLTGISIWGIGLGWDVGISAGLGINLGVGLANGLVIGLTGPIYAAIGALGLLLLYYLVVAVIAVTSREFWRKVGFWLKAVPREEG